MKDADVYNYLSSINLQKLNIVFCEHMNEKSRLWNFEKHSHNYMELICFLEGKTRIEFDDKSISVSMYDIIVYPPHVEHQEFLVPDLQQDVIAFGIEINSSVNINSSFKITDRDGALRWLFEHVYSEYRISKIKSPKLVDAYLQSIFLNMIRYFSASFIENTDIVDVATSFIHKNFSKEIHIHQLTSMVSVSPSYLNRIFLKKFNQTPMQYVNDFRIKIAKQLLDTSGFSIEEIAFNVGFNDSGYFWRVFKKKCGISPSEYRKDKHPNA